MVCRPYSAQGVVRGFGMFRVKGGVSRSPVGLFDRRGFSEGAEKARSFRYSVFVFNCFTACESPQLYMNGQLSLGKSDELLILSVVMLCILLLPGRWAH